MKIISADFIYTPRGYVSDQAVAFTQTIEDIAPLEELKQRYPDASIIHTEPNSILYPGFINTHVHLEFSANKTSLSYGSFKPWLDSVIDHREELMASCNNEMMMRECQTGTFNLVSKLPMACLRLVCRCLLHILCRFFDWHLLSMDESGLATAAIVFLYPFVVAGRKPSIFKFN